MKTTAKLATLLALCTLPLAGCSLTAKPEANGQAQTDHSQHNSTTTEPAVTTNANAAPTIKLTVEVEGNQATIHFATTNFTISPNHYNGSHVPGEGHIHLFVDGNPQRIAVKDSTYILTNLKPGTHKLDAQLHTNNHQPYNVKDEITFTIK